MPGGQRRHHHEVDGNYRRLPDSPVTALAFGPTTASVDVVTVQGILVGWAAVESTGTASASFDLMDGADDSGSLLVPVTVQAGQSTSDDFTSWGVWVQRGVRVKMLSGSVRGAVYFILAGDTAGR